ncbi:hypothetical protein [Streptomyces sp. bgisy022]|uniref:hypothetical protein n=1 Tax=Streptomyces sp. bgisy022 TaxID=3413769 RepID=UPI003D71A2A7
MTAQRPDDDGGTPDGREPAPSLPDDVWQRFLMDDEHAIRASAPKEPSAVQRAAAPWPRPAAARETARRGRRPAEAVGDLWHPDDPWEGPSWRNLDDRARRRRVGRVVGAAAAFALALGAWSQWSTGATPRQDRPGDTILQQSEEAPVELPATTSLPTGAHSASPATPAVQPG